MLAVVLFLPACTTQIDATHYDQACTLATDCAAVVSGDTCALCACPNAAVNVRDAERFRQDAVALRKRCPERPLPKCEACELREPLCVGGKCQLR